MRTYSMLVLTDHRTHSAQNSIYGLVRALQRHPHCRCLDIASLGVRLNTPFREQEAAAPLFGNRIGTDFSFQPGAPVFQQALRSLDLDRYDCIVLRIPPPVPESFWQYLVGRVDEYKCINQPSGMAKTGTKAFLTEVADLCPPLRLLQTKADVKAFFALHPIVLKPLSDYGGKGIIRLEGYKAWLGPKVVPIEVFFAQLPAAGFQYLGMEYQQRVAEGDKRIVVSGGQVIGAVLRVPATHSWLCNAAQGGQAVATTIEPEEWTMARRLIDRLSAEGIVVFGFDTLMGNRGQRVLSEINTTSIGGIVPMEQLYRKPLVALTADRLWNHINKNIYGNTLFAG